MATIAPNVSVRFICFTRCLLCLSGPCWFGSSTGMPLVAHASQNGATAAPGIPFRNAGAAGQPGTRIYFLASESVRAIVTLSSTPLKGKCGSLPP
jgi:hypothetical protein